MGQLSTKRKIIKNKLAVVVTLLCIAYVGTNYYFIKTEFDAYNVRVNKGIAYANYDQAYANYRTVYSYLQNSISQGESPAFQNAEFVKDSNVIEKLKKTIKAAKKFDNRQTYIYSNNADGYKNETIQLNNLSNSIMTSYAAVTKEIMVVYKSRVDKEADELQNMIYSAESQASQSSPPGTDQAKVDNLWGAINSGYAVLDKTKKLKVNFKTSTIFEEIVSNCNNQMKVFTDTEKKMSDALDEIISNSGALARERLRAALAIGQIPLSM
ncbi:MAG: hypothetical protein LBB07_02430 [Bifidobacteriaceae bacterium]|jgi:hypothetical protein|nr:hypothetical protein [Bifidobacteriaceae bacterium]